ncbi:hypothetical protein FVE85_6173 [Porphyridium purpureum]|uniref:UVR domain-containing protein n=1 Tax=Porphyridium purpureum TaxID=35688 RepID=A0A5J4Z5U0_PORPP|nr:hypothetical protein FVE85_6173 [Porphyridium purpureum]|eukprot:POR3000..scf295_1
MATSFETGDAVMANMGGEYHVDSYDAFMFVRDAAPAAPLMRKRSSGWKGLRSKDEPMHAPHMSSPPPPPPPQAQQHRQQHMSPVGTGLPPVGPSQNHRRGSSKIGETLHNFAAVFSPGISPIKPKRQSVSGVSKDAAHTAMQEMKAREKLKHAVPPSPSDAPVSFREMLIFQWLKENGIEPSDLNRLMKLKEVNASVAGHIEGTDAQSHVPVPSGRTSSSTAEASSAAPVLDEMDQEVFAKLFTVMARVCEKDADKSKGAASAPAPTHANKTLAASDVRQPRQSEMVENAQDDEEDIQTYHDQDSLLLKPNKRMTRKNGLKNLNIYGSNGDGDDASSPDLVMKVVNTDRTSAAQKDRGLCKEPQEPLVTEIAEDDGDVASFSAVSVVDFEPGPDATFEDACSTATVLRMSPYDPVKFPSVRRADDDDDDSDIVSVDSFVTCDEVITALSMAFPRLNCYLKSTVQAGRISAAAAATLGSKFGTESFLQKQNARRGLLDYRVGGADRRLDFGAAVREEKSAFARTNKQHPRVCDDFDNRHAFWDSDETESFPSLADATKKEHQVQVSDNAVLPAGAAGQATGISIIPGPLAIHVNRRQPELAGKEGENDSDCLEDETAASDAEGRIEESGHGAPERDSGNTHVQYLQAAVEEYGKLMHAAVSNLDFESAATYRDLMHQTMEVLERHGA